ncbi:PREDICTED: bax inhibitor 1 isoform X4 [Tarenaya hassleriana]|uniref:bax inhibitor 1 isoform X4 n=1 Tax=Tarenaya hassleriana TaxID=28532 RepID=UPI00053CA37D|nr:PREDICTED: bax inhibitor 1 isoform X4 [Tarenaya hassleriana]
MDAFSSFFYTQSSDSWTYDSLKSLHQISPVVQQHLRQVYLTLCCALVAAAIGAYLHLLWNVGGLLTMFGCLGSMIWLLSTPPFEERKRVALLMASALLQGASIGPLVELTVSLDPSILVAAFVGTALVFGCFSAAALLSRRREYLYLGGFLSSGLSILVWLHLFSSVFGGSAAIFEFELYVGLVLFVGYVVVDTQAIVERAHLGDLDFVKHSLTLFSDFASLFVRLSIILLKNSVDKRSNKKKKKRDG